MAVIQAGSAELVTWMVIETDEVPHAEVLAHGFEEIDIATPRAEVCEKYGVKAVYVMHDDRMMAKVN